MLGFLLLAQHLLKWFKLAAEANRLSISAAHGVPFLPPSPRWRLVWCSTKPSVCRLAAKKGVEMSWRYLPHGESTSSHLRKIRVVSVIISAYKLTHTHTHTSFGEPTSVLVWECSAYIYILYIFAPWQEHCEILWSSPMERHHPPDLIKACLLTHQLLLNERRHFDLMDHHWLVHMLLFPFFTYQLHCKCVWSLDRSSA